MAQLSTEQNISAIQQQQKSAVQVRLLKGAVYRAKNRDLWECLLRDQFQIREYFQQIGLSLLFDDAEGYAFLKQQDVSCAEEVLEIPSLITRRSLSFAQTLLLVALRKRLAEHDSEESSPRLIVSREEMHQWLQPYFPEVSNQVKQAREFNALIKKVSEMGFISQLPNHVDDFEVQRIIKAFVTAEQMAEFKQTLETNIESNSDLKGEPNASTTA